MWPETVTLLPSLLLLIVVLTEEATVFIFLGDIRCAISTATMSLTRCSVALLPAYSSSDITSCLIRVNKGEEMRNSVVVMFDIVATSAPNSSCIVVLVLLLTRLKSSFLRSACPASEFSEFLSNVMGSRFIISVPLCGSCLPDLDFNKDSDITSSLVSSPSPDANWWLAIKLNCSDVSSVLEIFGGEVPQHTDILFCQPCLEALKMRQGSQYTYYKLQGRHQLMSEEYDA
uniref:Uncharacterized protein n=1 Tax=Glossina pallidipes TaxID=7398 RepID=A0A1A9ZXS5_GLOPL